MKNILFKNESAMYVFKTLSLAILLLFPMIITGCQPTGTTIQSDTSGVQGATPST